MTPTEDKPTESGDLQRFKSTAAGSSSSLSGGVAGLSEPVHLDRKRFSVWAAVGIQWSTTAAPLAILSSLQLVIGVGGSPFYFWAFVVAAVFQFMVAMSLAELASSFPHTAGMQILAWPAQSWVFN